MASHDIDIRRCLPEDASTPVEVFRAVDGEIVPRATVAIEHNSRGTTWSIKYSHPHPEIAMQVALDMHLSMASQLGEPGGSEPA